MKSIYKTICILAVLSIPAIFSGCNEYEDEAPRVDSNNAYFYFPTTEMTSAERAEYEAIKEEYKNNVGY